MNTYRVDRNSSPSNIPCGMNSLIYIGDSFSQAKEVFKQAAPRQDVWGKPNTLYGVTLAIWNEQKREYVVKMQKGFSL